MQTQGLKKTIELYAAIIYNSWKDQPGWVEWTPLGNSNKQVEARVEARKLLESWGLTSDEDIKFFSNTHIDVYDESNENEQFLAARYEEGDQLLTVKAIIHSMIGSFMCDFLNCEEGKLPDPKRYVCTYNAYRIAAPAVLGEAIMLTVPQDVIDGLEAMIEGGNNIIGRSGMILTYGVGETHFTLCLELLKSEEEEDEDHQEEGHDEDHLTREDDSSQPV